MYSESAQDADVVACLWTIALGGISVLGLYMLWKYHPWYGGNPGIPSFPIVGSIPQILLNKDRLYEWSVEIFEHAQALTVHVFMGPYNTTIATADPQNVHHILKSHFDSYPKGPDFYPYFFDVLGRGIFNCDGPLWRFQRKVASHVFNSGSLRDFVVDIINTEICYRLTPLLDSACEDVSGCPIDLQALVMDFTFDTISQLTFGTDPARLVSCKFIKMDIKDSFTSHGQDGISHHMSERDDDMFSSYMKVADDIMQGFAEGFSIALQITADRFLTAKPVWQIKRWLNIGSEKKLQEALTAVNKFASYVIEKCKRESNGRKDILSRFVQLSKAQVESLLEGEDEAVWKANSNEHSQVLSDSLLRDILLSFMLAGRDSVACGITFMIWHLCLHPRAEEAIYEEIKKIMGSKLNGTDQKAVASFSYDEVKRMHYLHAALSESMRLYPPAPSDPKYAACDDVLPSGTKVYKGNIVSYNVFVMGRARQLWGDDCLEFKPDRWLGEDGLFVPVSPFKYPVFQAGLRTCLGKDFAYIQMKMVVASLVRDYKFSLSPGYKPSMAFGINLSMKDGLPVIVKRRISHS